MNTENFKGLSIEELEERAEFAAVPTAELANYSEAELSLLSNHGGVQRVSCGW